MDNQNNNDNQVDSDVVHLTIKTGKAFSATISRTESVLSPINQLWGVLYALHIYFPDIEITLIKTESLFAVPRDTDETTTENMQLSVAIEKYCKDCSVFTKPESFINLLKSDIGFGKGFADALVKINKEKETTHYVEYYW